MRIPEHNWETQSVEYREYPDHLFEEFLVWVLSTSRWHEDPERMERKVLNLKRALAAYRSTPDTHREAETFAVPTEAPAPAVSPVQTLAEKRRENLAKARAARKAKKELAHAEG